MIEASCQKTCMNKYLNKNIRQSLRKLGLCCMWWMYIYSINSRKQKIEDKRSNYRPTSLMLDKRTNIIHYYKVNMIYQYNLYLFSTCIDEICIHGVRDWFVRLNRMTYVPWYLFKLSSLSLSKHLLGRDFADKNANWYQWYWTQGETDTLKAVGPKPKEEAIPTRRQGTRDVHHLQDKMIRLLGFLLAISSQGKPVQFYRSRFNTRPWTRNSYELVTIHACILRSRVCACTV